MQAGTGLVRVTEEVIVIQPTAEVDDVFVMV